MRLIPLTISVAGLQRFIMQGNLFKFTKYYVTVLQPLSAIFAILEGLMLAVNKRFCSLGSGLNEYFIER